MGESYSDRTVWGPWKLFRNKKEYSLKIAEPTPITPRNPFLDSKEDCIIVNLEVTRKTCFASLAVEKEKGKNVKMSSFAAEVSPSPKNKGKPVSPYNTRS